MHALISSDGGCDYMGRGKWGHVVRLKDDVQYYAGRLDPGPGTDSPYRSEAYGLLTGLWITWTSQITGGIQLTLDTQKAISAFQCCELL